MTHVFRKNLKVCKQIRKIGQLSCYPSEFLSAFEKFRDFAQKSGEQEAKLIHHATLSFGKRMLHETVPSVTIIC
jgi:hypothetical protein